MTQLVKYSSNKADHPSPERADTGRSGTLRSGKLLSELINYRFGERPWVKT